MPKLPFFALCISHSVFLFLYDVLLIRCFDDIRIKRLLRALVCVCTYTYGKVTSPRYTSPTHALLPLLRVGPLQPIHYSRSVGRGQKMVGGKKPSRPALGSLKWLQLLPLSTQRRRRRGTLIVGILAHAKEGRRGGALCACV